MATVTAKKIKGDEGESELNTWFNDNNLCYLFLSQDPKIFAALFPGAIKRPDFLVLIESVGLIAVDAKNYTCSGGVYTLELEKELVRVLTFERLFRIPVWYAYKGQDVDGPVWYWISALKALEVGQRRAKGGTKKDFLAIKLEHFAAIRTEQDMGLLYTQRHKNLKPLQPGA